jgi:hypothetical protein
VGGECLTRDGAIEAPVFLRDESERLALLVAWNTVQSQNLMHMAKILTYSISITLFKTNKDIEHLNLPVKSSTREEKTGMIE